MSRTREDESMLFSEFGAPVTDASPEKAGGQHLGAVPRSEPPLVDVSSYLSSKVDLYGDLLGDDPGQGTLLKTQVAELSHRTKQQEQRITVLENETQSLRQQVAMLSQERDALATNISSLYNTAKLEMQRKDAEIKDLRQRLSAAAAGPSRPAQPAPPRGGRAAAAQPRAPSHRHAAG